MSDTSDRDRGLLSLIERLVKRPEPGAAKPAAPAASASADNGARDGLDPVVPDDKPPPTLEPQLSVETTRHVSRAKLTELIVKAMQAGDNYPEAGFEITVYGLRPWNAMLRITPAAGPVAAEAWRARLQTVVQLFREQYEVAENAETQED